MPPKTRTKPKRTPPKSVEVAQRRAKMTELYCAGWNAQRIYEEGRLGYSSAQHVRTDLARALDDLRKPQREYVDLQLARLEGLMRSFYPAARSRDARAADAALKVHDRIASLLGLNHSDRIGADDGDLDRMLEAAMGEPDPDILDAAS